MTRLTEDWLQDIPAGLDAYNRELKQKTGYDLSGLGAVAGGIDHRAMHRAAGKIKIAVIPVTTGLGIIGHFAPVVAHIAGKMGFVAEVIPQTDVDGFYHAATAGFQLLLLADDHRFLAINLEKNRLMENNRATARGYVAALEGAAGGLSGREVAVLGCGRVGSEACSLLRKRGAYPVVYARNSQRQAELQATQQAYFSQLDELSRFTLVFDANPIPAWLEPEHLHPQAWIAAPGVPLSLTEAAREIFAPRLLHDYLPIGVAAMIGSVV